MDFTISLLRNYDAFNILRAKEQLQIHYQALGAKLAFNIWLSFVIKLVCF
jgi:hypothetical protein